MTKFEEEFNYLIELSGKVLIGQVDAEAFEKNRIAFFEKYETDQQQALPVVPECVAVQIERVKNSNGNFATLGLFDWNHETKPDYTKWIHENVSDFMRACTIGYQVEKPQLFYLREKNTGYYLRKTGNDGYEITPHYSNDYDEKYMHYKFTQYEIDSMETGSYELVPVEDGE